MFSLCMFISACFRLVISRVLVGEDQECVTEAGAADWRACRKVGRRRLCCRWLLCSGTRKWLILWKRTQQEFRHRGQEGRKLWGRRKPMLLEGWRKNTTPEITHSDLGLLGRPGFFDWDWWVNVKTYEVRDQVGPERGAAPGDEDVLLTDKDERWRHKEENRRTAGSETNL